MKRLFIPSVFLVIILIINCCAIYFKGEYDKGLTLNVLMFHVVCKEMPKDKSLSGLYITDEMLREYCRYFIDKGYNIVSLKEAYDIFSGSKKTDNPNLLAFTFDDGYEDNYTLAFPILKEFGVKFNINIIARYTNENYSEYTNYLTWDELREMYDSGLLEVGSHSYDSHNYVTDYEGKSVPLLKALLPNESKEERKKRIFEDLNTADQIISEEIGDKINIMAYPYGVPPFDLKDEIAEKFNYYIELMVRPGVNRKIEDFKELYRFTVKGNERPEILEKRMKMYKGLNFIS